MMPTFATSIEYITGNSRQASQARKAIKASKLKRKKQNYLFAGDIILCVENPKECMKESVKVNKFSSVSGYEINMQNSVAFLYNNDDQSEEEIK